MHGEGIFRYASKAKYEGSWVENKYSGQGKYTWPSGASLPIAAASIPNPNPDLAAKGACYEGEWLDNKMHGKGVYVDVHGASWSGRFYNGHGPGLNEAV